MVFSRVVHVDLLVNSGGILEENESCFACFKLGRQSRIFRFGDTFFLCLPVEEATRRNGPRGSKCQIKGDRDECLPADRAIVVVLAIRNFLWSHVLQR